MKKTNFIYALAAGSLLLGSCSSEDALNDADGNNDVQQFVLQVSNTGDGLTTRAGRDLYASNADQDIQNVKVMIKDATGKVVYVQDIANWQTVSKDFTTNGHGKQITITLKGDDKLPQGTYTVVAVGYSDNSDYTFAPVLNTITKNSTLADDITATYAGNAEEVFAGGASLEVDANKKFTFTTGETGVVVTLHRQVAGALGYFQNIPASVDGVKAKYLRLVMRTANTKLTFNNFNSTFAQTDQNVKYVVNGSVPTTTNAKFADGSDGNVLYSIDLTKWFTDGDTNGDGFLGTGDTWTHPTDVETQVVKNSVFAGQFVYPYAYTTGLCSMELQLVAEDGTTILRTWNINIPDDDMNTNEALGLKDESKSVFNVVRNHMYNLGEKLKNDHGTDPDTPTPGTDDPEDLSKNQSLIIKVNDNWEAVHHLVID